MLIRVLGPLAIETDSGPIDLSAGMQRTLTHRLVAAGGQVVSVDRLIDDLWGQNPPATAIASLRVHVSRVRAAIGDAQLITQAPGYALRLQPNEVDVSIFERLAIEGRRNLSADPAAASDVFRKALALWRGDPYAEVEAHAWARAEIARLREARLRVLEDRIDADLACDRAEELLPELEALTVEHPLRERLWAARMTALFEAGRQAEALRAFQDVRRHLVDELGLEPSASLSALESAIASGTPVRSAIRRRASRPPLAPDLTEARGVFFIGRDGELDTIAKCRRDARSGRRAIVFVGGEPGIGKTRLVAEAARAAYAQGDIVLFGRCDEGLDAPYQPFLQAIRSYAAAAPTSDVRAHAGDGLRDLARVVPELADGTVGPEHDGDAALLFEAMASFLESLAADENVVLVVDDLHWATDKTLALTRRLLRGGAAARLVVCVTYRDTELPDDHPLSLLLRDTARLAGSNRIDLHGLDRDGVAAYLAAAAGGSAADLDVADRVYEQTGGNPFFVAEVVANLAAGDSVASPGSVPATVREVLRQRLGRLSDAARRCLGVASAAGLSFALWQIEDAVEPADRPLVIDSLEEAGDAGLLRETGPGTYAFGHALVRQTAYESLSASRRMRLHNRLGTSLAARPGADERAAELARHFLEAVPDGAACEAIDWCTTAGMNAQRRGASREAVTFYDRALVVAETLQLDEPRRVANLHYRRWRANLAAAGPGAYESIRADIRAAALAVTEAGDPGLHAEIAYWGVNVVAEGQPDGEIASIVEGALRAVEGDSPAHRALALAAKATYLASCAGDATAAQPLSADAVALARASGQGWVQYAALSASLGCLPHGRLAERRQRLAEMEALAETSGDRWDAQYTQESLVLLAIDSGDSDERRRGVARLNAAFTFGNRTRALDAMVSGDLITADALLQADLGAAIEAGAPIVHAGGQLLFLNRDRGQLESVVPLLEMAVNSMPELQLLRAGLALVKAEVGDTVGATATLEAFLTGGRVAVPDNVHGDAIAALLVDTVCRVDATVDVTALDSRLRARVGSIVRASHAGVLGAADRFVAMIATRRRDFDEAMQHYEAALALEERLGAPALTTRTRLWWARALEERGAPGDATAARGLRAQAQATAASFGFAGLAREAEAAGVRER